MSYFIVITFCLTLKDTNLVLVSLSEQRVQMLWRILQRCTAQSTQSAAKLTQNKG